VQKKLAVKGLHPCSIFHFHVITSVMTVTVIVDRRPECVHEHSRNYLYHVHHCAGGRPWCLGAVCIQEPTHSIWTVPHQGKFTLWHAGGNNTSVYSVVRIQFWWRLNTVMCLTER
jgi:hypothetical protein